MFIVQKFTLRITVLGLGGIAFFGTLSAKDTQTSARSAVAARAVGRLAVSIPRILRVLAALAVLVLRAALCTVHSARQQHIALHSGAALCAHVPDL